MHLYMCKNMSYYIMDIYNIYIHTQLYTYTLGVYPCCISIVASVLFTLHGRIMRNLNCCCFYLIQFLFYPHVILIDVSTRSVRSTTAERRQPDASVMQGSESGET